MIEKVVPEREMTSELFSALTADIEMVIGDGFFFSAKLEYLSTRDSCIADVHVSQACQSISDLVEIRRC